MQLKVSESSSVLSYLLGFHGVIQFRYVLFEEMEINYLTSNDEVIVKNPIEIVFIFNILSIITYNKYGGIRSAYVDLEALKSRPGFIYPSDISDLTYNDAIFLRIQEINIKILFHFRSIEQWHSF